MFRSAICLFPSPWSPSYHPGLNWYVSLVVASFIKDVQSVIVLLRERPLGLGLQKISFEAVRQSSLVNLLGCSVNGPPPCPNLLSSSRNFCISLLGANPGCL